MGHYWFTRVSSYLAALAAVVIALLGGAVLHRFFDLQSTLLLFFAAVAVSAAYGGTGPALLAIVLSWVAEHLLLSAQAHLAPFDLTGPAHLARSASFLVISLITTGLIASIHRQQARVVAQTQTLLDAIQEADRRKDVILSTVAHELRNPLGALSNAVELWSLHGTDRQQGRELRAIMRRQVCHMSRLIEDLMDIPRIAHGHLEYRARPLQLGEIIRDAVEEVKAVLDGCRHELCVELPSEELWVLGDPDRLRQVFGNILHNAAKYTPPGGSICLSVASKDRQNCVRIRDNGMGIPVNLLDDVFTPFMQVDKKSSQSRGGVGIGLALVKQLVELHAGHVEAHSEGPGKGSEFVVTLPAFEPSPTIDELDSLNDIATPEVNVCRNSIMIVDDRKEEAATLARMLYALGQDVVVAHDGASAVEAARCAHSNVAIVDLAMPQMDGYEVARQLRAQPATESMTLVALTGIAHEHSSDRAYAAGFDRYLTKPATAEALEHLLEQVEQV